MISSNFAKLYRYLKKSFQTLDLSLLPDQDSITPRKDCLLIKLTMRIESF